MSKCLWLTLAATCLLQAQSPSPMTVVHLYKVKPGGMGAWNDSIKKYFAPAMSKLLDQGTVLAYGADEDIMHFENAPNYAVWTVVPNYAAYEKVIRAVDSMFDSMPPAAREKLGSLHDANAHSDMIIRSLVSGYGKPKPGVLPYSRMMITKVKPGKLQDYRKAWEQFAKPVLDQLVKDEAILGYSLDNVILHTSAPGTVYEFTSVASLADLDKVEAAMQAEREKLSPEQRAANQKMFAEMVDSSAHRDGLMRAVVFATK